jgi:hypothetical protein
MPEVYDDIVLVKSRTGQDEEFRYDGKVVVVPAKKGLRIPRYMARYAVDGNALRWDSTTGLTAESKVFIEDDAGTEFELPSSPIKQSEIDEIKATDGLGDDVILIEGKAVRKKAINLKPTKEQLHDAE